MGLRTYILMVLVGISGFLLYAQQPSALSQGSERLTTIPLNEAEQHLIERKNPTYPLIAKAAKVEGTVRLTLEVDSKGAVVRVAASSGPAILLRAAINAAEQYRYRPFEIDGVPADVLVEAAIHFSLPSEVPAPQIPFPVVTSLNSVHMNYDDGCINVDVAGNGVVRYSGTCHAVVLGEHKRHIRPEEVRELLASFRRADFFSLRDSYSVGATDVGTTITSIQIGDLTKVITDDWVQVPATLKSVQHAILKYSHSDQWVKGNADTVPSLLAESSNPTAQREMLSNILPRAALYSDADVVRDILAYKVDVERRGPFDGTPLMLAASRGVPAMVGALLKAGANAKAVDREGRDALIFGAQSGNATTVQLLLSAGLRGDDKDKFGDTALMAAAATGNPKVVRMLLNAGAEVNARNSRRQTALLSGATGDSGFSFGEIGRPPVKVPEQDIHRGEVVTMLLDAGADINARGWFGDTALFSLEDDAVRELVRHGINLEIRDNYGETALIETVSPSIAEILIKAGANVNARDKDGTTPLIQAAENNFVDKLKVLVKAPGIRLEERDNKGETALMKARANNLQDCVRVLLSAGAKNRILRVSEPKSW